MTRHPIRSPSVIAVAAAMLLHVSMMQLHVHGFAPSSFPESMTSIRSNNHHTTAATSQYYLLRHMPTTTSSSYLRSSNGNDGDSDDEAQRLKEKANQYRAEAEKLRLTLGLKKIDTLEKDIREFMKGDGRESDKLQELKDRVEVLVKGSLGKEEAENMLAGLSSFASTSLAESKSTSRLTDEEIKSAVSFLGTLPTPVKDTLAKATGYPSYDSIINLEEFVINLYLNEDTSMEKLRRLYYQSYSQYLPAMDGNGKSTTTDEKDEDYAIQGMSKLLASKVQEQFENSTRAMDLFPRSVQDADEDILPTEEDAQVVFQLLEKSFMATEKPMKVDGGYIIRGTNKRKSASELLDFLDANLAKKSPEWTDKYQLSLVEIYSDANEELFEDAILLTPNKFVPLANKLLVGFTTAISLFSSVVYCITTFAENPAVMEKLKSATELAQDGGVYDLTWFNELLVPLLVTLGAAQGFHELAHYSVAWLKQVSDYNNIVMALSRCFCEGCITSLLSLPSRLK